MSTRPISERIEQRAAKLVDWHAIGFEIEEIESYIAKMQYHHLDYTHDIQFVLNRIREIFEVARGKAKEEMLTLEEVE
jgi:hypothetical protein